MKAAIFNPYLDTLGGGERYTVGVIRVLRDLGYTVHLQWNESSIVEKLESRFGVKVDCQVVDDIKRGDGYDLCFWISDGSIPTLRARKNILHFQVPFTKVGGRSLINKMKLWRVIVACNSQFTKNHIDSEFGIESKVVYPPVDVQVFKPKKKEKTILYVGRFSKLLQSKRQDVLIEAFKRVRVDLSGWKLVIAGGVEVGGEKAYQDLIRQARGAPIEFIQNPSFIQLKKLYAHATLFWSAAGYEVSEKSPEKMEHFGMTVVEAMAAGCLPVLFNGGGYREIITHGKNGILWDTPRELITFTKNIVREKEYLEKMLEAASETSEQFSFDVFAKNLSALL